MGRLLLVVTALAAHQAPTLPGGDRRPQPACVCANRSHCAPIQTPIVGARKEIFGFGSGSWQQYDWGLVTTVIPTKTDPRAIDPQLICHAHAHGARVVAFAPGATIGAGGSTPHPMPLTANVSRRRLWVAAAVAAVQEMHLDGLNFDVEEELDPADPRRGYYAAIVGETRAAHVARGGDGEGEQCHVVAGALRS